MKQAFLLKSSWIEIFNQISDKQAGLLIKSLYEYNVNGEIPTNLTDIEVKAYLNVMLLDCKAMNDNYDRRCETSAANGRLGGRPKNLNKPNSKPKKPNNLTKAENENENENDIKKTISNEIVKEKVATAVATLAQRIQKFSVEVSGFSSSYDEQMLREFTAYWTEPNQTKTKFRAEMEKTWDTSRRLGTWAKRERTAPAKKQLYRNGGDYSHLENEIS